MIWQCTEILAVIVECMIVTRMLIQYFKFRSEDCCLQQTWQELSEWQTKHF